MSSKSDRKVLLIIFVALIISVLTLTMAYAVLSTTLEITGTAQVQSAKWDIHFANVSIKEGSVQASKVPIIEGNKVDFDVTLNKPGDFYEFTVDVVNAGTIDAMIESILKTPTLTETHQKYLTYNITYNDGNAIGKNQLLKANKQKTIKVNLTYRKDLNVSDIPKIPDTLNLSFHGIFVQADNSSTVGPDGSGNEISKVVKMVKGDINNPQIGDMFSIKNERFHIYNSTETTITGIAEYNLYVAGDYKAGGIRTPYGSEATGIQNSEMKGYIPGQKLRRGTSSFTTSGNDYKGSIIEGYINNYSNILHGYGVNLEEVRLINSSELSNIFKCSNRCPNTYPWIYSTSYWTGTPSRSNCTWYIISDGGFNIGTSSDYYDFGVRPVVTIKKSEFK